MVTIKSKFMGDFKVGDNINHNLDVLGLLYRHYGEADEKEKRLLCKPIILLGTSNNVEFFVGSIAGAARR